MKIRMLLALCALCVAGCGVAVPFGETGGAYLQQSNGGYDYAETPAGRFQQYQQDQLVNQALIQYTTGRRY